MHELRCQLEDTPQACSEYRCFLVFLMSVADAVGAVITLAAPHASPWLVQVRHVALSQA